MTHRLSDVHRGSCSPQVSSVKANIGHAEPAAGLGGIFSLITSLFGDNSRASNAELRSLNQLLLPSMTTLRACLGTQRLQAHGTGDAIGVSSFGYSGTIAHLVLRRGSPPAALEHSAGFPKLTYQRQKFGWKGRPHEQLPCVSAYAWCWAAAPQVIDGHRTAARGFLISQSAEPVQKSEQRSIRVQCHRWEQAVVLLSAIASAAPAVHSASLVLGIVQLLAGLAGPSKLMVLTAGTQHVGRTAPSAASAAAHGSVWGLARVVRLEHASLQTRNADVAILGGTSAAILGQTAEEAAWSAAGEQLVARLRLSVSSTSGKGLWLGGTYAITGGLGGLGLRAATLLVAHGACRVTLSSRSGRVARDGQRLAEMLERVWSHADVVACDCADADETRAFTCLGAMPNGVLHAAGVSDRGLLAHVFAAQLALVGSSKASAAWHLQSTSTPLALEASVMFSSVGSGLGNVGQACYAAANAHLDAIALNERAFGRVACSMQWPLVHGAGMGAIAEWTHSQQPSSLRGFASITVKEYTTCLQSKLSGADAGPRVCLLHHADVSTMLRDLADGEQGRFDELRGVVSEKRSSTQCVQPCGATEVSVLQMVRELAGEQASLSIDTPLMEAGIDSLAATELSARLRALTGASVASTLIFEHPTARAITAHIAERVRGYDAPVEASSDVARGSCAVMQGLTGRWPGENGGQATALWRELAQLHASCGDGVGSVPALRWTLADAVEVSLLSETQRACAQHGGFVHGAERFDSRAFGISHVEASAMDPQQRMLLEVGYASLHAARWRRSTLMGADVGVCVGIERPDWALAQPPSVRGSLYALMGDNVSVAAGRACFVLGLQGACASIDTACSSALVAVHSSSHVVRGHECEASAAMAVSLKLVPHGLLSAASAGMLSVDGRCKTLDARANGYVRSEAIGACVICVADGTIVSGMRLGGSAVRQDGRSASLTAPNGSAQRRLLLSALLVASVGRAEVSAMELHGTGTALGDPTEAGAQAAVYGRVDSGPALVVGAAKASIGHGEAASGQVGVLRTWQVVQEARAGGNAKTRVVSPLVRERLGLMASHFVLPVQGALVRQSGARGVSSFGFSGTIAHVTSHKAVTPVQATTSTLLFAAFVRSTFTWRDPPHPFAQQYVLASLDVHRFRSPASGPLHELVEDHVVLGRVIFPAAGYLELARAVSCASRAARMSTAALSNVFFLQPLTLGVAGLHIECTLSAGHFDVHSGSVDPIGALTSPVLHCSGVASTAAHHSRPQPDHPWLRSRRCGCIAEVSVLYDWFSATGLEYGPAYRTLAQLWHGANGVAVAQLRRRLVWRGTEIHPADLDDALCVSAMHRSRDNEEVRLPFAADDALLCSGSTGQWAVRTARPESACACSAEFS